MHKSKMAHRVAENIIAMARGILVLDENLYNLKEALEDLQYG